MFDNLTEKSSQDNDLLLLQGCNGNFPMCDGSMNTSFKPINRNGIKAFLVEVFGDNYEGNVTPNALSNQLHNYEDVGEVACQRPFSKKQIRYK